MPVSGDAAEEIVKLYLEGIEFSLRISGKAAKQVATALYVISQDKTKTRGKTRLSAMLKSGKELKIFTVRKEDLKVFYKEAKRYWILYCALSEKNSKDGLIDIMVRAEDASKINRIFEKFKLNTVDTVQIKKDIEKELTQSNKNAEEKIAQDIIKLEEKENYLSNRRAEKGQLKLFSSNNAKIQQNNDKESKKSVRAQLVEIKAELEQKEKQYQKTKEVNKRKSKQKIKNKER